MIYETIIRFVSPTFRFSDEMMYSIAAQSNIHVERIQCVDHVKYCFRSIPTMF